MAPSNLQCGDPCRPDGPLSPGGPGGPGVPEGPGGPEVPEGAGGPGNPADPDRVWKIRLKWS